MKPHTHKPLGMLLGGLLLSAGANATELVYTPVNPSFGGSPLNGAWLLGNAGRRTTRRIRMRWIVPRCSVTSPRWIASPASWSRACWATCSVA